MKDFLTFLILVLAALVIVAIMYGAGYNLIPADTGGTLLDRM